MVLEKVNKNKLYQTKLKIEELDEVSEGKIFIKSLEKQRVMFISHMHRPYWVRKAE